jgi:hypothetical protein
VETIEKLCPLRIIDPINGKFIKGSFSKLEYLLNIFSKIGAKA